MWSIIISIIIICTIFAAIIYEWYSDRKYYKNEAERYRKLYYNAATKLVFLNKPVKRANKNYHQLYTTTLAQLNKHRELMGKIRQAIERMN